MSNINTSTVSNNTKRQIEEFFQNYAKAATEGQNNIITQSYAETYIEAGPKYYSAFQVNDEYRQQLDQRTPFMRDQLGYKTSVAYVEDIREFAPSHFIADVRWTMDFEPPGRQPVTSKFIISYILRRENDRLRILMYVSHEDEQEVMRRDGILPRDDGV